LPDETLYSLCARIHRLTCNARSRDTARQLFGHAHFGTEHDFTSNIAALASRSAGQWGTARELALGRTLLSFYLPFHPLETQEELITQLACPGIGHLKFRLGLLTSRFRAHHPIKVCSACMKLDRERYGTPYWHRGHQLPGVWVCLEHSTLLSESTSKSNGVRRFDWLLPDDCDFRSPLMATAHRELIAREPCMAELSRLARNAQAILQLPCGTFLSPAQLTNVYRTRIRDRYGVRRASRDVWAQLVSELCRSNAALVPISEMSALAHEPVAARRELERMLRAPRSGTHPLRHLALVQWLFEDWESFFEAYRVGAPGAAYSSLDEPTQAAVAVSQSPEIKNRLITLVTQLGASPTGAALQLGIDTTTAMAWLAQAGIRSKRRPKKLRSDIRTALISALLTGTDKAELAARYGLSVVTITTLLRTEPELHERWQAARHRHSRTARRAEWESLVKRHPDLTIKGLRAMAPACHGWLYRNDKAWLDTTNAAVPRASPGNHSELDWPARDAALARQVREAALKLTSTECPQRIKQWQITQALPELRAKIGHLDRLPQTREALSAATAVRPSFPDLFKQR